MRFRSKSRTVRPSRRLFIESLEDRAVPAYDLAIDGDTITANVSEVLAAGTTTFTATGTGATLDVADIESALAIGNVIITTGVGGGEPGDIDWTTDSLDDELDYLGANLRSLRIVTSADATSGAISASTAILNFDSNVDLTLDSTSPAADGLISFAIDSQINFAATVTVNAGTNLFQLESSSTNSMASGDITITASFFQNNSFFTMLSDSGNIAINAALTPGAFTELRAADGNVTITGAIDSAVSEDLSLYGENVTLNSSVGALFPLGNLTIAGGDVTFTGVGTSITATNVNVGDGNFEDFQTRLFTDRPITAEVSVYFDGTLSPGGSGTTGTMNITGNLFFFGGNYDLDLGAVPDKINVTGDLDLTGGANLFNTSGTGALPNGNTFTIVDTVGDVSGEFDFIPLNTPFLLGADAIKVTAYGPDTGGGVDIQQVAASPNGMATGVEFDGTAYTIKLTGPGTLTTFANQFGQLVVLGKNTTLASKIDVKTKANASDDLLNIGTVSIGGDLGSFTAKGGLLNGGFSGGAIKSISFFDIFSNITLTGPLTKLTTGRDLFGSITAPSVGDIKVGGVMGGFGGPWIIPGNIKSITADAVFSLDVVAQSIGKIAVTGDKQAHIAGDIIFSSFQLTGNDGTPKQYGLKSLTVAGKVENTTFDVEGGNVGKVKVGRFIDSNLYIDYSPTAPFNTAGTFDSAGVFRLESFVTTATTLNDPNNPNNFAFSGSQIAADTIGTVKLTGLNTANFGNATGFKFRSAGGSIQVKSTSGALPLNTNLTPGTLPLVPLEGDFFYLDV